VYRASETTTLMRPRSGLSVAGILPHESHMFDNHDETRDNNVHITLTNCMIISRVRLSPIIVYLQKEFLEICDSGVYF
jgi:hypothetical protein